MAHNDNERRNASRLPKRVPVRFWAADDSRTYTGTLVDQSEHGAFIETDDSLPLLSNIRIEGDGLTLHAHVIRVFWIPPDMRSEKTGGIAVRKLKAAEVPQEASFEDDSGVLVLAFG